MQIIDFVARNVEEQKKQILVVSDQKNGQALLKKYGADDAGQIRNISCQTLKMMLNSVYLYLKADSTCVMTEKILTNAEASLVFRDVLLKNIGSLKFFSNPDMINVATAKEIYDKVNLVRLNGWNGKEDDSNSRIVDIKTLIDLYDKRLSENNQIDTAKMYEIVLDRKSEWASDVALIFGATCSYLADDMQALKGQEKEFLDIITAGSSVEVVEDDSVWTENIADCKLFKGYGSFNEANFVVNDILANNLSFGDVEILYSNSNQLPALMAVLPGNSIPVSFESSYPLSSNESVDLANRIVEWSMHDFDEVYLERILSSTAIKCMLTGKKTKDDSTEEEYEYNALYGSRYCDYILKAANRFGDDAMALGWNYKRNLEFVEHEKALSSTDESIKLPLINMHEKLVKIFGEDDRYSSVKPSVVFDKLAAFLKEYTHHSDDKIIANVHYESVKRMVDAESRELPFDKAIDFIYELLHTGGLMDSEYAGAVKVRNISKWSIVNRPYLYIIGLSLMDMQGSATESPILTDDEMENYLGAGYIPTVANESIRKECNLKRTIAAFDGDKITLGYSFYDTVGFCETNPSAFLHEVMDYCKIESKDLEEFVYGNPPSDYSGKKSAAADANYNIINNLPKSSTSLETTFLKCPRKYAYKKILNIPDVEFRKRDVAHWLDAKDTGLFFHALAENYIHEYLIGKVAGSIDKSKVEAVAEVIKKKMLIQTPADTTELAGREVEKLVEGTYEFLCRLNEEYKTSGYRALAVEEEFVDSEYSITDLNGNKYDFSFRGTIDRIDYRVASSTKTIELRIGDYKTGKKGNKQDELKHGKLVQYVIYHNALMNTGKSTIDDGSQILLLTKIKKDIAAIESIGDIDDWNVVFESFRYEFPLDETTKDREIVIFAKEIEGINIARLKTIFAICADKHIYPTAKEILDELRDYIENNPNEPVFPDLLKAMTYSGRLLNAEGKDNCKYCPYLNLCDAGKEWM